MIILRSTLFQLYFWIWSAFTAIWMLVAARLVLGVAIGLAAPILVKTGVLDPLSLHQELLNADTLPKGGQDPIRRVLFKTPTNATPRPLLAIIQEKNRAQGKPPIPRADLRFDPDASGRIFVLNKGDGVIRVIER